MVGRGGEWCRYMLRTIGQFHKFRATGGGGANQELTDEIKMLRE